MAKKLKLMIIKNFKLIMLLLLIIVVTTFSISVFLSIKQSDRMLTIKSKEIKAEFFENKEVFDNLVNAIKAYDITKEEGYDIRKEEGYAIGKDRTEHAVGKIDNVLCYWSGYMKFEITDENFIKVYDEYLDKTSMMSDKSIAIYKDSKNPDALIELINFCVSEDVFDEIDEPDKGKYYSIVLSYSELPEEHYKKTRNKKICDNWYFEGYGYYNTFALYEEGCIIK